jgi:hypothetical protein
MLEMLELSISREIKQNDLLLMYLLYLYVYIGLPDVEVVILFSSILSSHLPLS